MRNPLVVALDTSDLRRLSALATDLGRHVGMLKVGLEAFAAHGVPAVEAAAAHAPVFLDLKLHDIPATVAGAARAAVAHGARMVTVHASGGAAMVDAAVRAAPDAVVLAVTVLTSLDDAALEGVGQPPAAEQVPRLAALAVDAGAGGVVCAPGDVLAVREAIGEEPVVVTPGVRPTGAERGDQARVGTPRAALDAGADYLVVGRPITGAQDPTAAARDLLAELEGAA